MMVSHPLNASIIRSGTELFAKIGADSQISSLMQQIIAAANNPVADDRAAKVDRHCVALALFLTAPITNPVPALDRTWECLRALSKCLEEMPEKGLWANGCTALPTALRSIIRRPERSLWSLSI
eukprot:GHVS01074099.1.p1 GENE.GHVS01074099.1~~GHVS01074099.1.p1  ORF type:complete len:124 (-),score=7.35 GHVS01074099.1:141-512(-)